MSDDDGHEADGAGAAATAFAHAAVTWPVRPPGDPRVSAACLLGWLYGEQLALVGDGGTVEPSTTGSAPLPSEDAMTAGRIAAIEQRLCGRPPEEATDDPGARRDRALTDLTVADVTLGRAFRLGYRLQQLCAGSAADPARDVAGPLAEIRTLLADLGTALPPNAAHSVRNSLILWEEQLRRRRGEAAAIAALIPPQSARWQGLLCGELAAKDVLRLGDYVGTGEDVVAQLGAFFRRAARRQLWPLLLGVGALVALGVLLLWHSSSTTPGRSVAGAGSLVAALGLSWKGVGGTLGRAAARGEQALWNAQLDWTIAYRVTLSLPPRPQRRKLGERLGTLWSRPAHRGVAGAAARSRDSHFDRWQRWQLEWPSLDLHPAKE